MKIAGIYLAAGNSHRMGQNKLALPAGAAALGSIALKTALYSSLDHIFIMTKCEEVNWLPTEVKRNQKCTIAPCPSSHLGQSESLRYGIEKAQSAKMDAVMVMLADQPLITIDMIEELIAHMKQTPAPPFVAAWHQQIIMPPVLLSSSMFPSLLRLKGDTGAKSILDDELLKRGKLIDFHDEKLFFDVDTMEDYERLLSFL